MKKMLVIVGPTATGKTDLALQLARKFAGELICADSRQVYKRLDIGTGKIPSGRWKIEDRRLKKEEGFWEIDGVKIWMYDVVDLNKQYTVFDYTKEANVVLENIQKRNKLPILIGGTGLYIKALTQELSNLEIPFDSQLRKELSVLSIDQLQKRLRKISPDKFASMNNSDQNNPRRLIRVIELVVNSKLKSQNSKLQLKTKNLNTLKIGLFAPREVLYEKINKRVYDWIKQGILDEVNNLINNGINKKRFMELGMEYAVALEHIEGKISRKIMIEKMQTKVRQYAKRQITWFKKEPDIEWFDITTDGCMEQIAKKVLNWYN